MLIILGTSGASYVMKTVNSFKILKQTICLNMNRHRAVE